MYVVSVLTRVAWRISRPASHRRSGLPAKLRISEPWKVRTRRFGRNAVKNCSIISVSMGPGSGIYTVAFLSWLR